MPTHPELERVDAFGSRTLDRDAVLARWGDELACLVRSNESGGDPTVLETQLERAIHAAGDFAFVDLATITYFSPRRSFVTVDLVDAADRGRRMCFGPAPTATHADPDGLLALWREYHDKALGMLMDGTLQPTREPCPFWHCITFAHASLVPYRDAFASRVAAVERELVAVLREDLRAAHRGAAAFLLAHLASGPRVVEYLLPSIRDPDATVRNNAMRVLALIALDHPEIAIPLEPVLAALAFPATTDRNKAAAILSALARRPEHHHAIRDRAGDVLVDMLALRQPNNHDLAYEILTRISGRDLGEHAVAAWRAWVRAPR